MSTAKRNVTVLAFVIVLGFAPSMVHANISINVTGSLGDLDGDGDGGAAEDAARDTVVACWSARILTDRDFNLTITPTALTGSTRGQGAVSAVDGAGVATDGYIRIDNDGSTTWWVDPTPIDNSEFDPDPQAQWRFINGPAGSDLVRVLFHEIGHAMLWLCGASCGFTNPNYDALMNPAPGSFVSDPTCAAPFPRAGQPPLAGCVRLQDGGSHPYDASLRGDGLGGSGSSVVNELSHPGITGELMLGIGVGGGQRETPSDVSVDLFNHAYLDMVNLPPTLDAGGPTLDIECSEPGGSTVQLDATGSSDPEGDPLSWAWSCDGVGLSGANTATPSGFFALDQTVTCRLDASDLAACPSNADSVDVTVSDTTAPMIQCPGDVTVECTGNCGIDASDPQLAAFFGGVSAFDVCDASVAVSNDAPAFLDLGDTVVTFTATDDSTNHSSCQATVTVEDTTQPDIELTLDRDSLWPPNHKLVEIEATVLVDDICDPNAGFELTSVTSSEPDDGLGDGDTPNDIQEADIGTADLSFKLRSERSGTGDGRVYTIVYTASDKSGNTRDASATVTVPHDRAGSAGASDGFDSDGTAFQVSAVEYSLIVLSTPDFDATLIDRTGARVGNTAGTVEPLQTRTTDFDCDGRLDLQVTYPVAETVEIDALAGDGEPPAFRYETFDGQGYLVPDVFGLGSPISSKACRGAGGTIGSSRLQKGN